VPNYGRIVTWSSRPRHNECINAGCLDSLGAVYHNLRQLIITFDYDYGYFDATHKSANFIYVDRDSLAITLPDGKCSNFAGAV